MDISAIDIGRNFLIDYYENLCSNPKGAYGYFKPSSQFNFAENSTSKSFSYVVGNPKKPLNLHEKYFERKYIHVLSHDIQLSGGGGLLLIVIGKIVDNEDNGEQKDVPQFIQTFFLVPSYEEIDRGNFFILNSTFRFVNLLEPDTKNSPIKKKVEENVSNGENKSDPSSSTPTTITNITNAPNTNSNTSNNAKGGENKKKDLIVKSKDKITILKKSSDPPSSSSSSSNSSTTPTTNSTSTANTTSPTSTSNNSSEKSDKEEEIITSNENVNSKPEVVKTIDFQKKSFLEVVASNSNITNNTSKTLFNNSSTKTAPTSNNNNNTNNTNNNRTPSAPTSNKSNNNSNNSNNNNSNNNSNNNNNNNNNNKEKRDKKNISPSSVFVRNVPYSADQYRLEEFFSKYGKIKHLDYLEEKRYAFVNFETVEESENLLRIFAKEGVIFEGKGLHVEKRREKRTNDSNNNSNNNNNNNKHSNNRKNK